MVQEVIIIVVGMIFLLIIFLFFAAILRRIANARKYREMDRIRAYYLGLLEQALEKRDIISVINDLLATPESIKFRAIEDVLFKLQNRFPEDIKELFVRLGYVDFYERMLFHKNRIKKAMAIDKLGQIGIDTSVNKISFMLKTDDREIASVTIRALSNIGSLDALSSILDNIPELFSKWLLTRKCIETALLKFGDRGSSILIQYAKNIKDPKILAIILDSLSHLNNARAIEPALDNLYHPDPEVRTKALKVIERFSNLLDGSSIEKVLSLSKDPVWFVRLHVARILGKVNGKRDVISYLGRLVLDKNWNVRDVAAAALAKKGEAGLDEILKILRGGDRYAMESLCEEIEKTDLCKILVYNLAGPDREVSLKSKEILRIMNRLGFSTPLKNYLQTGEEPIRKELKILFEEMTV